MTPTRGLLENRPWNIGMLLFCSYVAVASWLTITQYGKFPHDPFRIFGLAFVVFCCASIAYRSSFSADRGAFGAATAAIILMGVRMATLTPLAMLAVGAAESLMWTIAAAVTLVALVRSFKTSHRNN